MTISLSSLVGLAVFLPLLCFAVVGALELRQQKRRSIGILGAAAIVLGIGVSVLLVIPLGFFSLNPASSVALSKTMTLISALVAGSVAFGKFNSKISSVLVVVGGAILAFFWFFNRIII
jgi:hypothetical protein